MSRFENLSVLHNPHEFPLQMLEDLKPNWDSYGAPPLDKETILKAFDVWRQLDGLSGHWSVVPMSSGGIQIEQHRDGWDIEVVIERCSQRR